MIYIFLGIVLICIVVAACISALKTDTHNKFNTSSAEIKGDNGEHIISKDLAPLGKLVNNLMLRDGNNITHQIDHVLINEKGVFVVETKNYSGYIYGYEKQEKWTQVLQHTKTYRHRSGFPKYPKTTKNQFYNPIKQNNTHIYHISKILPKGTKIFNCVVFVQDNVQHIDAPNVFTREGLKLFIQNQTNIYNKDKVQKLYDTICTHNENIDHREHIQNIYNNLTHIQTCVNNEICPRCGGKLELRKGKYSTFYGCSNYPKCKFTKK